MRRSLALFVAALSMLALPGAHADVAVDHRVIVSSTLNDELQIFGATSLTELQTPVLSKGAGPVRLWVQKFGGSTYLLVANHGVEGSLGVFDLSAQA